MRVLGEVSVSLPAPFLARLPKRSMKQDVWVAQCKRASFSLVDLGVEIDEALLAVMLLKLTSWGLVNVLRFLGRQASSSSIFSLRSSSCSGVICTGAVMSGAAYVQVN